MTGLQERHPAQPAASAHRGEDAPVREVYAAHRSRLRRYLLSCGYDKDEVDDAVQDSIMAVRAAVLQGREIANLKAYWYRAAVLRAGRLSKQRAARLRPVAVLTNPAAAGDGKDLLFAVPHYRADQLAEHMRRLEWLGVIGQLPRRQAQVFWLSVLEDFAEADIAEILSIKVGTVKSTLHAAKKRLAELLSTDITEGESA